MSAVPDTTDSSPRLSLRERLGIAPEEVAVVAPGRVHRRSGHRFAVWAVSILKIAECPVRMVIQQTGQGARAVAAFARMTGFGREIIMAGADWAVSDLLTAADAAVFLDMDRPDPALLAAAMSAGLPIVAGDVASVRDLLINGRNALLVRPDRPREIAQALMKLIEDKALAERLGAAARSAAAVGPAC